jgi:hypothetical protein
MTFNLGRHQTGARTILGGRSRLLDEADGLDWPTLGVCDLVFAMDKAELKDRHGRAWK